MTQENRDTTDIKEQLQAYFSQLPLEPGKELEKVLAWRMLCFNSGQRLVTELQNLDHDISKMRVLDVACAWGGHALAFALAGAKVTANDLNDHELDRFQKWCEQRNLDVTTGIGDCLDIAHPDDSFDLVLGLEIVEHIPDVEKFASEVERVLCDKGIAIVSTPARLRSFWEGEPHYGIRFLTILPFSLQGFVARTFFKKDYPFPITQQFANSDSLLKPFLETGLSGTAFIPLHIEKKFPSFMVDLLKKYHWKYVILKKE